MNEKIWTSWFWSKFSKIPFLVKIFGNTKFWVNFSENLEFGRKKYWNFDTGHSFRKFLIWGQNFRKFLFFSAFSEIISILVKKNWKLRCWSKSLDNRSFGQPFRKSWFRSKVSKNLGFRQYFRRISTLLKISENGDFGLNFRQNSILDKFSISVKIRGILDSSSNNLDFGQNFQIVEFCQKLS